MDVALLHGLLLLLTLPVLLYWHSATFRYFCKVTFFNIWVVTMATLLSPFVAIRGRCVENMNQDSKLSPGAAMSAVVVSTWSICTLWDVVVLSVVSYGHTTMGQAAGSGLSDPRWIRLLCAVIRPLKHLYGIKIEVLGAEHLNLKEPYVIVCNHQASLDLMGMVEVIPKRCVPIAKKELLYMGTVGWACWLSGIIFIDRQRTGEAIDVISQTAKTIRRENLRVWIFPEGTRNQSRSMLPFKRGAFHLAVQAQVPIFPVVISPYWNFFSSKEKKFTPGMFTIRVLPKIETRGLSPKDVPELTETVRNIMVDVFSEMSANPCGDQRVDLPLLPGTGATTRTDSMWHEEDTTGTSD